MTNEKTQKWVIHEQLKERNEKRPISTQQDINGTVDVISSDSQIIDLNVQFTIKTFKLSLINIRRQDIVVL